MSDEKRPVEPRAPDDRRGVNAAGYLPLGISLGLSIGIVFGLLIFDNVGLGISLGLAIGAGLGVALSASARGRSGRNDGDST